MFKTIFAGLIEFGVIVHYFSALTKYVALFKKRNNLVVAFDLAPSHP
jgi:hypothetical protein